MEYPILSIITLLPLLGALFVLLVKSSDKEVENRNAKNVALLISGTTLILAIYALTKFDASFAGMQFVEDIVWVEGFNMHYKVGVDGISLPLILLTALLTPICILVSWNSIQHKVRSYMAAFLALEAFVIGVFCALDFILFYIYWEAMLIPMFLIVGIWGGENRIYAALKFFLYTFVGSVLMLVAIMYLYYAGGMTFDILELQNVQIAKTAQLLVWLALFAAFAVKVPMWPFHTWLPDAHVQAPTAGSVILAGILLKMGGYGFLRFSMPMLPEATAYFAPMVFILSAIAIVYTALVAFAQTDIKKMIAYSSVSHMGFVTLGIFAATTESVQGAMMQMINHGIVSSALFMLIGVIYERMHTRDLERFGGIVNTMPVYAAIFMLFTMAAVGLPGTNSFVGEFLILLGSFENAQVYTVIACLGVVLGAVYMLTLYKRMVMGKLVKAEIKRLKDVNMREFAMFVPLILLVVYLGLMPNDFLNLTEASVAQLVESYQLATTESSNVFAMLSEGGK